MTVDWEYRSDPSKSGNQMRAAKTLWRIYRGLVKDDLEQVLRNELKNSKIVLDVGSGKIPFLSAIPSGVQLYVALDLHRPYLRMTRYEMQSIQPVLADATMLPFKAGSFDTVICLNLLEHLDKARGYQLIDSMKGLTNDKILLQTPNGFLSQSEYDDDKYQEHRSGWTVSEISGMGFKIAGIRGLKSLRAARGDPRLKPFPLGILISDFSRIFVDGHPEKAFSILGIFSKPRPAAARR